MSQTSLLGGSKVLNQASCCSGLGETPQVPTQTALRCNSFHLDSSDQRQPFWALSVVPLRVGSLSQSVLLIYRNPKPAPSATRNTRTDAGVAVVFAYTARIFSEVRPHQNLPVAFFAWFRRIPFPPLGSTKDISKRSKRRYCGVWRFSVKMKARQTGGCCIVECYYSHFVAWRGRWMVGINEQGEEEIPSCGRNWMVILKEGGGGAWCRGCCQSPDSSAFVFSIITCCTSSQPFLPAEGSFSLLLFLLFPKVCLVIRWSSEAQKWK